jgi:hypothetical protein
MKTLWEFRKCWKALPQVYFSVLKDDSYDYKVNMSKDFIQLISKGTSKMGKLIPSAFEELNVY